MDLARRVEGIPAVNSASERDTLFPSPLPTQRVFRIDLGLQQRFTSASGWVTDGLIPAVAGEVGASDLRYAVGNVKRYGAVGDGVTNDRAAIQAAMTAVAALGGGEVTFPPASAGYYCTSALTIPSNVTLVGCGYAGRLIFSWTLASVGSAYITNDGLATTAGNTRITLRNLWIQGAGTGGPGGFSPAPAAGLLLRYGTDYRVEGCTFYRIPGISFSYQSVKRIQIIGNVVRESGRDGITGFWLDDQPLEDIVIADNVINTLYDDAIQVSAGANGYPNTTGRVRRVSITGNVILHSPVGSGDAGDDYGRGIALTGVEDFTVTGNVVDNTASNGIHCVPDDVAGSSLFGCRQGVISGNVVRRAGQTGDAGQPRYGLLISGSTEIDVSDNTITDAYDSGIVIETSSDVTVAANRVLRCGTGTTDYGIDILGDSAGTNICNRVKIAGNVIKSNAGAGIRNWYSENSTIQDNVIADNGTAHAASGTSQHAAGIYSEIGARNASITGNRIFDTAAGAAKKQSYAIRIQAATSSAYIITGNALTGNVDAGGLSFSGTPGRAIVEHNDTGIAAVSATRGDASVTLVMFVDSEVQRFSTALTANRTVTLPTANLYNGARFRIVRTGLGAFTLDVGGLKTIPNSTAAFVDVAYEIGAWRLTGYGTL